MTSRTEMRVDTRIALAMLRKGATPLMDDWLGDFPGPVAADDDPALPAFRYAETVAALGFDPLHACPEHRERCAGAECCCESSHRVAS